MDTPTKTDQLVTLLNQNQHTPMETDPPVGGQDQHTPMETDPPVCKEDQHTPMETDPPVKGHKQNTPMKTDQKVGKQEKNTPMKTDPPVSDQNQHSLTETDPPVDGQNLHTLMETDQPVSGQNQHDPMVINIDPPVSKQDQPQMATDQSVDGQETNQALDTLCKILEDTEVLHRRNYLKSLLGICYARQLMPLIRQLASNDCTGCLIDHPSQKEHDICVMTEFPVLLEMYLDPALAILEENVVIGTWFEYLARLQPKVRYHEISEYLDTNWRWDIWINDDWKLNMTMMLLELEENPYCFDYLIPH